MANIFRGHNMEKMNADSSDFMVQQIRSIQDESDDFMSENNELRRNYEDLSTEVGKLENQKQYFEGAFEQKNVRDHTNMEAVNNMRTRIHELIDLSEELKLFSTTQETSDLAKLRQFLEDRLQLLINRNNKIATRIAR